MRPKLAILSVGARSRSEAQRDEVIDRYQTAGAAVLRTYEAGAIVLQTDGNRMSYGEYKTGRRGELELFADNNR